MTAKKDMTGKPTVIKEVNLGLLKDALAQMGQATRVELARRTGISQPTVNVLIKEMTEQGEVLNLGSADSTGGRKAAVYTLNQKHYHILSVVVRKEELEYCIFDLQLQKETREKKAIDTNGSYTGQLAGFLQEILKDVPDVRAVCVGVPGAVSKQGEVFAIPQIPEWEHFGLQAYLEKVCSRKVMVRNDINAVAMGYLAGERMNGPYAGEDGKLPVQNLVYLHVEGTGLGAGIIIDGRLYSGSNSFAGEAGYMQIGCENLENQLTGADTAKREIILAKVLVNLICILNPEKIVLGGEITEKMTQHIKEQCCQWLPDGVVPAFALIPDSMEQYFMGLGQSALDLLDNQIRLH